MNKKKQKRDEKTLELLYHSFDSELEENEKKQLEEALAHSEELRREKKQIQAQRKLISAGAVRSFRPYFAERVINGIIETKEKSRDALYDSFKSVFQRFVIAGALLLVALIIYNLGIGESLSMDEVFYASEWTVEEILQLPLF